ncbi:hypothetical protein CAL24_20295 [Bordetella genomosp. 2]|uniref:IclR family transcriptional regulator n=2 Tax=Bordetella TaxID=517 RepID=A0A261VER1_9BORD|nr:hypothetical protein CAL24_20295 [Bordetella genomosp. 2]
MDRNRFGDNSSCSIDSSDFADAIGMNNTLVKGMQLLEYLARHGGTAGITDLGEALSMVPSMVHRLLQTWIELGYVRKEGNAYRATLKLWQVGVPLVERLDVRSLSMPAMTRLQQLTHESILLSVLEGDDIVFIAKLDSLEKVRSHTEVGGRAPSVRTASGKMLIATLPEHAQARYRELAAAGQADAAAAARKFDEDIRRTRVRGWASNRGEWHDDVCGLAAPVIDPTGRTVAAIGLSGPASRLTLARVKEIVPLVVEAGRQASLAMAGESAD